MPLDRDKLFKQFEEMIANAKEPTTPDFLNDDRLEDAFLIPETDNEGYSPEIPAIWSDYGYGKCPDGVLFITLKSAFIKSSLYIFTIIPASDLHIFQIDLAAFRYCYRGTVMYRFDKRRTGRDSKLIHFPNSFISFSRSSRYESNSFL